MCFDELKAAILMVILNHHLQPSYLNAHVELHLFFTPAYSQGNIVLLYFALIWFCTSLIKRNCNLC